MVCKEGGLKPASSCDETPFFKSRNENTIKTETAISYLFNRASNFTLETFFFLSFTDMVDLLGFTRKMYVV